MAERGSIGKATFDSVTALVAEGMTRSAAFAKVAEETGRTPATVATAFYRVARDMPDGGGVQAATPQAPRRRRRAAGPPRARPPAPQPGHRRRRDRRRGPPRHRPARRRPAPPRRRERGAARLRRPDRPDPEDAGLGDAPRYGRACKCTGRSVHLHVEGRAVARDVPCTWARRAVHVHAACRALGRRGPCTCTRYAVQLGVPRSRRRRSEGSERASRARACALLKRSLDTRRARALAPDAPCTWSAQASASISVCC